MRSRDRGRRTESRREASGGGEAWRGGGAWRGSLSSRGRGNKVSHQGNERGGPAGGGSCGNRGISHVRRRRRSPHPITHPLLRLDPLRNGSWTQAFGLLYVPGDAMRVIFYVKLFIFSRLAALEWEPSQKINRVRCFLCSSYYVKVINEAFLVVLPSPEKHWGETHCFEVCFCYSCFCKTVKFRLLYYASILRKWAEPNSLLRLMTGKFYTRLFAQDYLLHELSFLFTPHSPAKWEPSKTPSWLRCISINYVEKPSLSFPFRRV